VAEAEEAYGAVSEGKAGENEMTGHIRRRGERSWELKFDLGTDPATGKRRTHYGSFKGTKREAEAELTRLKAGADRGEYVDPSKLTLTQFLDRWEAWAAGQVSAKTLERYKELTKLHVRPHLGAMRLQKLRTVDCAVLYSRLQKPKADGGAGLAPRTVGHVHGLMHRALSHAVKWSLINNNPVAEAEPPRFERQEIEILTPEQAKALLHGLRGHRLYPIAVIGLATGMRRGELVALRWGDIELDRGKIRVERSLEQTNEGLRLKPPKTKAGRREIGVPASIVAELRAHWRRQQEQRLALGVGRSGSEELVFPQLDGTAWRPDSLSSAWANTVRILKLPLVTLHALRHSHVSQLIAMNLDVVTVSRRIGHSNPTITLNIYSHLWGNTDERASAAVETAMASLLAE
jgi:integrase